ncbi:mechanosensitive ion channel family protein [Anaerobacillus sp. MEB173]|uniref:mechanosensitive ion channel family protein n=1 Tax=Anaerobacillus sp. MEB173 TaxID=3383345 RepID=UPI003F8D9B41
MNDWLQTIAWEDWLTTVTVIVLQLIGTVIAFYIVKSIGKRVISTAFKRMSEQRKVSQGRVKTLEKLTMNIFSYVLIFIAITFVVGILGLEIAPLIAGAGVVGLAIGFGAQGLVSDVVTGFFLLLEKQIEVDDYITTGGVDGVVEQVGLRTTQLRGFDGTLHFIPNREITQVSNHSRGNMRALVDIGISYDDNIDKVIEVLQQACEQVASEDQTIIEGPNVVGVQSFGASEVVIRIIAKTENMAQWAVERKLRKVIKETLDQNGIEIPFPHQVYIEKKAQN